MNTSSSSEIHHGNGNYCPWSLVAESGECGSSIASSTYAKSSLAIGGGG
jgi:hypothetical protein